MSAAPGIQVDGLCLTQGAFRVSGVSFAVPVGGYAVLMGPTGCGKTSVLEAVCGLRRPTAGTVRLGGVEVTDAPPAARGVGYVPQDGALFPTMRVGRQIAFALKRHGYARPARDARLRELAERLRITPLLERRPLGLSGGERQRVALARALAHRPAVLCLDEPLSALDEETRDAMLTLIEATRGHERFTALHVTHATSEADRLATVRLRMRDGQLVPTPPSTGKEPT